MNTAKEAKNSARAWLRGAAGAAAVLGLASITAMAYADDSDDPTTMAPPVSGADGPTDTSAAADNASQDTVFNWKEVPENQTVPIVRAVFDQGGYQLYDNVGETIIVPFTNDNLYVMKFAVSHTGKTYFVNTGDAPVLYVPRDGYLENATVAGAKWYPFPKDFHETEPVYLGIAPSWNDYVDMGWYPDMAFYGGYYCDGPWYAGIGLFPTVGLFIDIGGHAFFGWHNYIGYVGFHPGWSHVGYFHRDFYRWAGRSYWWGRTFGFNHGYAHGFNNGFNHGYEAGRSFGGGHAYGAFAGHSFNSGRGFGGGGHAFRGATGGHFGGGGFGSHSSGFGGANSHGFGGGDHFSGGGEGHFGGASSHAFGGGGGSHFGGGGGHFGGGGGGHFGGGGGGHFGGGGGHFGGGGGGGRH